MHLKCYDLKSLGQSGTEIVKHTGERFRLIGFFFPCKNEQQLEAWSNKGKKKRKTNSKGQSLPKKRSAFVLLMLS